MWPVPVGALVAGIVLTALRGSRMAFIFIVMTWCVFHFPNEFNSLVEEAPPNCLILEFYHKICRRPWEEEPRRVLPAEKMS